MGGLWELTAVVCPLFGVRVGFGKIGGQTGLVLRGHPEKLGLIRRYTSTGMFISGKVEQQKHGAAVQRRFMLFDHLRDLEYLDRNVVSAVKFNRTPAGKLTHLAIYIYIYIYIYILGRTRALHARS